MRKNNLLPSLFVAGVLACGAAAAGTVNAPVLISLQNGSQAAVALSNTEPNLFSVPGGQRGGGERHRSKPVRYAPTALWCSARLTRSRSPLLSKLHVA